MELMMHPQTMYKLSMELIITKATTMPIFCFYLNEIYIKELYVTCSFKLFKLDDVTYPIAGYFGVDIILFTFGDL